MKGPPVIGVKCTMLARLAIPRYWLSSRARRQLYIWVEQDDRPGSILELTNLLAWDIAPARLDERLIPWPHSRLLLNRCWPRIGRVAASKIIELCAIHGATAHETRRYKDRCTHLALSRLHYFITAVHRWSVCLCRHVYLALSVSVSPQKVLVLHRAI